MKLIYIIFKISDTYYTHQIFIRNTIDILYLLSALKNLNILKLNKFLIICLNLFWQVIIAFQVLINVHKYFLLLIVQNKHSRLDILR